MKRNPIQPTHETVKLPAARAVIRATKRSTAASRLDLPGCAALMLLAAAGPAVAQTTNVADIYNLTGSTVAATVNSMAFQSYSDDQARLTIGVNESSSSATEVSVNIGPGNATLVSSTTNFVSPDYFITNTYDLDASVATLAATGVPATGGGAEVVLGAQSITNTTGGDAGIDVSVTLNYTNLASGDYDMAVEATGANTWRFPIPVKAGHKWSAGGATTDFADPDNWVGGVVPGANDIVITEDAGLVGSGSTPTISVMSDTTIGSVSDIHTTSDYQHWNIAEGATLSVLGEDGFRQLVDYVDDNERSRLRASGAGTMIVSNANAEFNLFTTRQNNSFDSADFSALNTLILDVKRIAFNDIAAYPNYVTNGAITVSRPYRNVYDMDWALTNILRATLTDGNQWTNNTRDYSMVINRERSQTGSDGGMHFGLYNELYMDSILFGGYAQMENPEVDFRSDDSYLLLRNTDKVSRVSNLTLADAMDYYATEDNGGGTKVDVSFTKGTVDALVDTLIIARDPLRSNGGPSRGRLYLGAGTFDVNNAILGYQTGEGSGTEANDCAESGTLYVTLGGTFRVNDSLVLGYLTTNNLYTAATFGQLNVSDAGSTAEINTITVGGPTNDVSQANNISVSGGGTLIVSNSVGSASVPLNQLSMSDSTIRLFPDVSTNAPCVFVKTLATSGTGNTIALGSINGVSSYPATVPLISYVDPVTPNFGLELPEGLFGYVTVNSGSSTIDAVITTNAPADLVWNGDVNGNWDTTTANWQGGKKFSDGDSATFDDSASGTTSVNVNGTVTLGAGGVLVSNETKAYSLSGGTIGGSAVLTKEGAGNLTIDATSDLALFVNNGSVNGSGALGVTTVETNGVLNYSGTIAKLTTRGVTENSGTINSSATVSGGVFNNRGVINGTLSTSGDSVTTNTSASTVETPGNCSVGSDSTLVQDGQFTFDSGVLSVDGFLTGSGTVSDFTGVTGNRTIQIKSGTFMPGGSNAIGTFIVEGRVNFNGSGAVVFDIDLNHPQKNDILGVENFDEFRGGFHFNNIGSVPFAAGQSFLVISNIYALDNEPSSPQKFAADKTQPPVPGVGLQWDFSQFLTNGIVGVMAAPLDSPTMTVTTEGGTNQTFSWPGSHLGYQLQVQTNNIATGLSTNWYPVEGTENVTSTNLPIDPANPSVFYRLSNQ